MRKVLSHIEQTTEMPHRKKKIVFQDVEVLPKCTRSTEKSAEIPNFYPVVCPNVVFSAEDCFAVFFALCSMNKVWKNEG